MHYISQGKKPALHKGVLHLIIGVYFLTGPRVVFSKIIIPQDLFHKVTSILLAGTIFGCRSWLYSKVRVYYQHKVSLDWQ